MCITMGPFFPIVEWSVTSPSLYVENSVFIDWSRPPLSLWAFWFHNRQSVTHDSYLAFNVDSQELPLELAIVFLVKIWSGQNSQWPAQYQEVVCPICRESSRKDVGLGMGIWCVRHSWACVPSQTCFIFFIHNHNLSQTFTYISRLAY